MKTETEYVTRDEAAAMIAEFRRDLEALCESLPAEIATLVESMLAE